jgi:hypothetical protein
MPSQLPSSQRSVGGGGGPHAPPVALPTTRPPATTPGPKSLKNHCAVIGRALERLKLSAAEQEAWTAAKEHLERCAHEATRSDAPATYSMQELREEVQSLTAMVKKIAEGNKQQQSWAQIARPAQLAPQLPTRKAREVLVTQELGANLQSERTAAEIVAGIKSTEGGRGEIIGARKLPSGAFALTFKSAEAKDQWKDQGKVTSVFGPGASIKESTLDVIVFGFPLGAISKLQPEQRVKAIVSQNPGLERSLRRVGTPKGSSSRRYETVILGFAHPQEANAAIEAGVLWESGVLNAEPYSKDIKLARCFQCQSYAGHKARSCRGQTKCSWCATIGHTIESCPNRQDLSKKACAPCGGKKGHCALDKHCPARAKEEERAKAAYKARPIRFEAPSSSNNARSGATLLSRNFLEEQDDEGFVVVGNKRKRGRPTLVSKADTTGIPSITSFLHVPEVQFGSSRSTASSILSQETLDTPPSSRDEEMSISPA